MQNQTTPKIRIGITQGDINGVNYELVIKAFADNRLFDTFTPVFYGSSRILNYYKKALRADGFSYVIIKKTNEAQPRKLNLIEVGGDNNMKVEAGQLIPEAGQFGVAALQQATEHAKNGWLDALVTLPLNKQNIISEQYPFAGHTQYLASAFGSTESLMFLVNDVLRVGVVTEHIALHKVTETLSQPLIVDKITAINKSLIQDFGIRKPKIAVLGVNPHAGDNGVMGNEESTLITPAIEEVKQKNICAFGPFPACGFFGSGTYAKYDAILAMYHDQGLIPFKLSAFDNGVNFTAGLPIVRTSPIHGTGYDIAGKNIASPSSFIAALFMAHDILKNRATHVELNKNPLPTSKNVEVSNLA